MSKRRPYVRSMDGWWKKNPHFVEYMIHEGTAVFVAAYALTLLCGLVRLGQGEAAWNAWLEALKSPFSLVAHVVFLAAIAYHAFTWFKLFPLTMPPMVVNGKKVAPEVMVNTGLAAAVAAALALLGFVWRIAA
ncbi:fumarate reductase subunit C [Propionivibrio limicola]|uniref:fumarate reductase subunit C n=1 Tax=Propionivibrio limicola TaxID=167645 RepID=UPI0012917A75|nr:fumarate reductase subunit C [Propionivibrio limicola]